MQQISELAGGEKEFLKLRMKLFQFFAKEVYFS
jgi:hypothetical protein